MSLGDINQHKDLMSKVQSLYVTRPTSPEWLRIIAPKHKLVQTMVMGMVEQLYIDDERKKCIRSYPYTERHSVYKLIDDFLINISPTKHDAVGCLW